MQRRTAGCCGSQSRENSVSLETIILLAGNGCGKSRGLSEAVRCARNEGHKQTTYAATRRRDSNISTVSKAVYRSFRKVFSFKKLSFIVVDHFSKFVSLKAMREATITAVVKYLKGEIFRRTG